MPGGPPLAANPLTQRALNRLILLGARQRTDGDGDGSSQRYPGIIDRERQSTYTQQAILPLQLISVPGCVDDFAAFALDEGAGLDLVFALAREHLLLRKRRAPIRAVCIHCCDSGLPLLARLATCSVLMVSGW